MASKDEDRLTISAIEKITKPGLHPDGRNPDGLYIQIAKGGTKTWIYRYRLHGRLHKMGLGPFEAFNPTEARNKRDQARKLVKEKIDPIEARKEKKKAKEKALEQKITLAEAREGWRNSGRQLDWNGRDWAGGEGSTAGRENSIWALYGEPNPKAKKPIKKTQPWLGPYQVTELVANKGKLIIEVFTEIIGPLNYKKSALQTLQHIRNIIDWAIDEKNLPMGNPVNLKRESKFLRSLPSLEYETKHFKGMPWREVPDFVARLHNETNRSGMTSADGRALASWAIEFQIYTAARPAQARFAQWDEFSDLDADQVYWTVPLRTQVDGKRYYRRKRKDPLLVPLNTPTVNLLRKLKKHQEENGGLRKFVFSHDLALTAMGEDYHLCYALTRQEKSKYGQSAFRFGGGKPLRANAVKHYFMNSMGIKDYDLYGFRSSFKQFQIDHKYKPIDGDPELAAEAVLHHKVGNKTRNAYAQGVVPYDAMRELLDHWGQHCVSKLRKQKLKLVG